MVKEKEKDNQELKNENQNDKIAVKDIDDKTVDVESLDPETLEVAKLISPEA